MMDKNARLNRLYNECIGELKAVGINVKTENIVSVSINEKMASKIWGRCSSRNYKDGEYTEFRITLNPKLFIEGSTDEQIKNTLTHELLHTLKDCQNHGVVWQKYCDIVNDCYAFYNLKRCGSAKEKKFTDNQIEEMAMMAKYVFKCSGCGVVVTRDRASKFTNMFKRYSCKCGAKVGCWEQIK